MNDLQQQVHVHSLDHESLAEVLNLPPPLGIDPREALRQLAYVERYVKQDELGGRSFIVEDHYIDRDYMEDHSVFYSKSLYPYRNHCRRLHFFTLEPAQLLDEFGQLREKTLTEEAFHDACDRFSTDRYLGFCVIKPLPGCPVGRTVLKSLPGKTNRGFTRHFDCSCNYQVHLLGVPLSVNGLAFQQQDLGVSACATTALWSSLQRARELEATGAATPAQITMRASQYHLPFGRPMPSDGLSLDQMCQAIRSLGYSPNLYRAESYEFSRNLIYSAVRSRISPVLILSNEDETSGHAVATAGMKLIDPHTSVDTSQLIDDNLGGHPNPANEGHLKTGQRRRDSGR